jgi:hypothetical protein
MHTAHLDRALTESYKQRTQVSDVDLDSAVFLLFLSGMSIHCAIMINFSYWTVPSEVIAPSQRIPHSKHILPTIAQPFSLKFPLFFM